MTQEQLQQLQEAYTKDNLDKGLFFLARKFFIAHPFERWGDVNGQNILNIIDNKKTYNKTEMFQVSFSVFQNEAIIRAYLKFLPTNIFMLIGKLLFYDEVTDDEAGEYIGENIVKQNTYNKELKREFYFFIVKPYNQYINFSNYRTVFLLSLHPILKSLLLNYFPKPLYYNFIPLDEIPETEFHFNAEDVIQQELPRLLSYQMQQNIKYSSTGKPAEATLTKMQRVCQTIDFYQTDDVEIARMRNMLLAGTVYAYSPKAVSANNADVLKDLFNTHYFRLTSLVFVLQQLKGWQHISDTYLDKYVEKKLFEVFAQLPVNKWISVENLHEYLKNRAIEIKPIANIAARNYLHYPSIYQSGNIKIPEKRSINYDTYNPMVQKAFISGTVFLYAAFGLIEIAFNKINTDVLGKTYYSAYDGLQYLRLTPLGAYVLGISTQYENANAGKTNKLIFDEESLIITAEGDLEVINVSLANYTERLGNNRFRITSAYFLKDCRSYKDIQSKISLFKSTVRDTLPVNWENYFTQLLENAQALKEQSHIKIYKLPANAKELHRLIAQDIRLKKLILKAEDFNILVANTNVAEFKNRMKELGYIVE